MITRKSFLLTLGTLVGAFPILTTTPARAQEQNIHEQLVARGAPVDFADRVADIVAAARADGLPSEPLESKALEGWAKRRRVPSERVLTVLQRLLGRLGQGRDVVRNAGLEASGAVVTGAAEALGRGLTPDHIRTVVTVAPDQKAAATGLTVVSSLAAQGLAAAAAVRAVSDAYRDGRPPEEVLEFPSAVAAATARGERMTDIGRRIMQGGMLAPPGAGTGGIGGPGAGGPGGRPPGMPGSKQGTKTQTNRP